MLLIILYQLKDTALFISPCIASAAEQLEDSGLSDVFGVHNNLGKYKYIPNLATRWQMEALVRFCPPSATKTSLFSAFLLDVVKIGMSLESNIDKIIQKHITWSRAYVSACVHVQT